MFNNRLFQKFFQQLVVDFEKLIEKIELPYHCCFVIPKKIIPYQHFYKKIWQIMFLNWYLKYLNVIFENRPK